MSMNQLNITDIYICLKNFTDLKTKPEEIQIRFDGYCDSLTKRPAASLKPVFHSRISPPLATFFTSEKFI